MALLDCPFGHGSECEGHAIRPMLSDMPPADPPVAGVCHYGCIAPQLWKTPKDARYLCRRHLRQALKVGGYPLPIED